MNRGNDMSIKTNENIKKILNAYTSRLESGEKVLEEKKDKRSNQLEKFGEIRRLQIEPTLISVKEMMKSQNISADIYQSDFSHPDNSEIQPHMSITIKYKNPVANGIISNILRFKLTNIGEIEMYSDCKRMKLVSSTFSFIEMNQDKVEELVTEFISAVFEE